MGSAMPDKPLAYFITFTTYGTWLHGQAPGSVDHEHNQIGTPFIAPDPKRRKANQQRMTQPCVVLEPSQRDVVRDAVIEECRFRGWTIHALHERSNHVHPVVSAEREPEFVMRACKATASKCLNRAGFDNADPKRWTAHGSTRYLWNDGAVAETVHYTLHRQDDPMATYDGTQTQQRS